MAGRILLIDDDLTTLLCNQKALGREDASLEIHKASSLAQALPEISNHNPQVIVLDLCLHQPTGVESGFLALKQILEIDPSLRVIVLTGYSGDEYGMRALNMGAANFLTKPVNYQHLYALIKDAIAQCDMRREYNQLIAKESDGLSDYLLGDSEFNSQLIKQIDFAAKTNQAILITGETGTGKGYIASLIHNQSERQNSKFVRMQPVFANSDLIASELFGHEQGSFTGAANARAGLFQEAHRGTLFLDEIDSFSLETQVALLGVLQDKKFRPLGTNEEAFSDFRLIAATNQDVEQAVATKKIRQDLYFRIAQFQIHLEPLRSRLEDLPLLADYFLAKLDSAVKEISPDALALMLDYEWPGNIRELESVVASAAAQAEYQGRNSISAEDLSCANPQSKGQNFQQQISSYKIKLVKSALLRNEHSKSKAARELGIDRSTLQRILKVESQAAI